ncbi:hypothetical protein F5141DRAFT_1224538 [Pisolithus sp. B1]|nr:hypothetical protein F5141DRAFT_1224538 [Pisolithus sp. B1]
MHVDVPVDAIIPDGVPSYDAMPELTSVMREPPSWHEHLEKLHASKCRRDAEPEKSTGSGNASFANGLQQDGYVTEATGQMGDTRQPNTDVLDSRDISTHDTTDPKQGGDNYEAAYAEVQYSSSNNKFATNAPDPEEGGDGKEATHQELGYSSGADKSMYDTEDPREDMDWEEESGGEFEDPLYIWPLEEYSSGTQGESVQPKATDIKGKKKTVDVDSLTFPLPLNTNIFSLDPESTPKRTNPADCGSTSQLPKYPGKGTDLSALQELQETLKNRIWQNMQKELGQIIETAIADAIAKAFSNGKI